MSTHIVHEVKLVRLSSLELDSNKDLYAVLMLSGASNTYSGWGANAKRARDWGMAYLGCESDVIAWAIARAEEFGGGCAVWRSMGASGRITPQQWISKMRKAIGAAEDLVLPSPESNSGVTGALWLAAKGEFALSSLREALKQAHSFTLEKPGDPTWHFLKVTGPGAT